jgi:DNA-binding NarL/FixJ family response regulator
MFLGTEEVAEVAGAIEEQAERALLSLDDAGIGGPATLPVRDEPGSHYGLSVRELEVLRHVANGLADKQIATELGLSTYTVSKHVSAILAKMEASSRTEAGVRAAREGLIDS